MANIATELEMIHDGVFGEDIRLAIYDALSKLNTSGGGGSGSSENALEFKALPDNTNLNSMKDITHRGIYRILTKGTKTSSRYQNLPTDYNENMGGFLVIYVVGTFVRQEIFYISRDPNLESYKWSRSYMTYTEDGTTVNHWVPWCRTGYHDQLSFRHDYDLENTDLNDLVNHTDRGIYKLRSSMMNTYTNLPPVEAGFNMSLPGILIVYVHDSLVRQEILHISSSADNIKFRWVRTCNNSTWSPWVKTGGESDESGQTIFKSWVPTSANLNDYKGDNYRGVYGLLPSNNQSISNLPGSFAKNMGGFLTVYCIGSFVRQEVFYVATSTDYLTYSFVRTYNGSTWSNWAQTATGSGGSVDPADIETAVEAYMTEHPLEVFRSYLPDDADLDEYLGTNNKGIWGIRASTADQLSNLPSGYNTSMAGFLSVFIAGSLTRQEVFYVATNTSYLAYSFVRTYNGSSWSNWVQTSTGSGGGSVDPSAIEAAVEDYFEENPIPAVDPSAISTAVSSYMSEHPVDVFKGYLPNSADLNTYKGDSYKGIWGIRASTADQLSNLPGDYNTSMAGFLSVFVAASLTRQEVFYVATNTSYLTYSFVRTHNGSSWSDWIDTSVSSSGKGDDEISDAVNAAIEAYFLENPVSLGEDSIDNWNYFDKSKLGIITPQMFGAIADGEHDCSTAIAAAISAGAGKTVYFPAGTYNISTAITTAKTHAAFANLVFDPGAIIKATDTMAYMLNVGGMGTAPSGEKGYKKIITGGTFESNSYVTASVVFMQGTITDVDFSNCTLKCNGCAGIIIGAIDLTTTSHPSTDNYIHHVNVISESTYQSARGVVVTTNDNHFDFMRIYNFKYCMSIGGSGIFMSNIHTMVNPDNISDSISFYVNGSARPMIFMDKCYGDTTSIFLKLEKPAKVNVSQCIYYSYLNEAKTYAKSRLIAFDLSSSDLVNEDTNSADHYRLCVDQFEMYGYRLESGKHVGVLVDSLDGNFFTKISKDRLKLSNITIAYPDYMYAGDILRGAVSDDGWIPFKPTPMDRVNSDGEYWYKLGTFQWGNNDSYAYDVEFVSRRGCRTVVPVFAFISNNYCVTSGGDKVVSTDSKKYRIGFKKESNVTVNDVTMCYISVYLTQDTTANTQITLHAARINTNQIAVIPASVKCDASQQITSETNPSGLTQFAVDCDAGTVNITTY